MINSLKEGSGIEGLDSNTASTMELEELRHERDTQREEIQKLMGQIQQMRTELQVAMVMYGYVFVVNHAQRTVFLYTLGLLLLVFT